jgi:hypothetical protein
MTAQHHAENEVGAVPVLLWNTLGPVMGEECQSLAYARAWLRREIEGDGADDGVQQ